MQDQMAEMEETYGSRSSEKQMPQGSNSPEENPEGHPTEVFSKVQEALFNLAQAVQGASAIPPEAQKALAASLDAYNQFMQITGEALNLPMARVQEGNVGPRGVDMVGSKQGAMPADMPAMKGAKPVPA